MSDMVVSDCAHWWKTGINVSWAAQKPKMTAITSSRFSLLNQSHKSLKSFVVPNFNATEQKKFNREIAMYFSCTGTSFMCVEDPHLHRAIQLARPNAKLPARKQLADESKGGLLEECYQTDVNKHLSLNRQYVSIISEVWSNVLNKPVVNYMPFAQRSPYFSKLCTLKSRRMMPSGSPKIWLVLWTALGKM